MGKWFVSFALVVALELYLLFAVGQRLGFAATAGVLLLSGVVGVAMARREGVRVLREFQASLHAGRLPAQSVTSGLLVLLGGVLLVIPGFLTDALGLLLLFPVTRRLVSRWLLWRVGRGFARGTFRVVQVGGHHSSRSGPTAAYSPRPPVIDVEGETVERDP